MGFQVYVTGLDPVVKALTRAAVALEGILIILQAGANAATLAKIEDIRSELKTGSDALATAVAAQNKE